MNKSVYSYSSKPEYYDTLYKYASILENMGHVALVPLDIKGNLPNAKIYDQALVSRNNFSLRDMKDQRIELSDTLVVYVKSEDPYPVDYNTMADILHAVETNKEIFVICDGDISKVIDFILRKTLNTVTIEISGYIGVGLNGGYEIRLIELKIKEIELRRDE